MGSTERQVSFNNDNDSCHNHNNSNTGHEGFDYWKDEFSGKIQELEVVLHQYQDDQSVVTANTRKKIHKLLKHATQLLSHLSEEAQSVSKKKDAPLRQELMDIYQACKMQLETYRLLQQHILMDNNDDIMHNNETHDTLETSRRSKSELWDPDAMEQRYSNNNNYDRSNKDQRQKVQANTQGKVSSQNSRLRDAMRNLRETQEIATEITGELQGQRVTLENTKNSMNSMKDMTQQAKGLVKSLNKKWWMKW
ncbi:hypothetical protein IV203_009653 [Nitzschia inconspicua]|uniref:t-SNARE coiled-coil homology domain-containing protein n=1 Tax=Nitzschia inconspicua TaxID=303405 RepID=A0A9K3PK89_9STRA|nr:hypothetical protein IV203_009653 [Nitzschia inconspicua]